jgi:hypothetical protein
MKHRPRFFLIATALCAAALAGAAGPATAGPPDPQSGPEAVAVGYLQARAAAVKAPDPGAPLALFVTPGSRMALRERLVARGTAIDAARLGHLIDSVDTAVTVTSVATAADGNTATVAAHVITTLNWHTAGLQPDVEASGVDHTLTLTRGARGWRVSDDVYTDVMTPAYLEDAGAPAAMTQRASRQLEPAPGGLSRARIRSGRARIRKDEQRVRESAGAGRAYIDTIVYKRDSAVSYADRYCLSYLPSAVSFSADCANFVSQCAWAGHMPTNPGTFDTGWWYDSHGTTSPSDDTYSWSWINVGKQMGFWNGFRTDWVSSINDLGRGDAVYYDWSGDGVWDHVAMVVGTNSAGQKVIDAHTTDHYHVYWKLGTSSARYKFARVRAQWIV